MTRLMPLDILRTVAILLVMVHHLDVGKDNLGLKAFAASLARTPQDAEHVPALVGKAIHKSGWMGVDLFFVLSGFLVSGLLFREYQQYGKVTVGRFLIRRGFKIYPPFYVFLGLTVLGIAVATRREFQGWAVLSEACFVQNYGPNLWAHTWSLAVEEHFYLLLALLILILARGRTSNPFQILPFVFLVIAALALGLRIANAIAQPEFDDKTHMFPTHLRIDSLLFGVVLSYYYHFDPQKVTFIGRSRLLLLLASLLLILPAFVIPREHFLLPTFGLAGLYLGFGGLLLLALSVSPSSNPLLRAVGSGLAAVGRHSYSIYLWHLAVLVIGVPLLAKVIGKPLGGWGEALFYFAGSIAGGILMAKGVEFPALKIRDYYFPSRAQAVEKGPEPSVTDPDALAEAPATEPVAVQP